MILPSEYAKGFGAAPLPGPFHTRLKRTVDVLVSGIGLILLLPVFILVAIAIKLDSRGPILYAQERVGKNRRRRARRAADPASGPRPGAPDRRKVDCYGRVFEIYKFRSMVADAEKHTGPVWATQKDARVTRVGKVLRKTRLDETPQLWNVLRGDMSLVGPRPELVQVAERYGLVEHARHLVRPGITGLWQVSKERTALLHENVHIDLDYVERITFLGDAKILLRTFGSVVRIRGS